MQKIAFCDKMNYICDMTVKDLAYIVTLYVNGKGEVVSPKKLQKLMYYVEAWNLVYLEEPFFEEDFEAWVHGPVLPSLYRSLKDYGFNNIKVINDVIEDEFTLIDKIAKDNNLSKDQMELIQSVLDQYASLNPFELEMLTHSEEPWITARGNTPPHVSCRNKISKESMKEFFSQKIEVETNV